MPSVKGVILLPLVKALRASKEEARALLRPELHSYLTDRILMTSWYPEEDHVELIRALGKIMGLKTYEPMGVALAHYELEGVYKAQLKEGDALRTLQGFSRFWHLHHDTGRVDFTQRRGGATIVLDGYALAAREVCDVVTGFLDEAIRMSIGPAHADSSARSASVIHTRCRAFQDASCVWEVESLE